jgi:hypothetical protein
MRVKLKFIAKVTVAHFVTYFICGMLFSRLFDYETLFELGNAKYFMRDFYGVSSLLGPFVQIIRGMLIGCILLVLKDTLLKEKGAGLKLWLVFAGLGIICAPSAAPVSIEGVVYTQLPLEFHLRGAPEILVQTLLFSLWAAHDFKPKSKWKVSGQIKIAAIVTAVSGVGFSLGGVLLVLVLKIDITEGTSDPFAFLVMLAAMIIVFLTTAWYLRRGKERRFTIVYYLVCYFAIAILPAAYNYLSDSALKSPLSLVLSGWPVIVIGAYLSKQTF